MTNRNFKTHQNKCDVPCTKVQDFLNFFFYKFSFAVLAVKIKTCFLKIGTHEFLQHKLHTTQNMVQHLT